MIQSKINPCLPTDPQSPVRRTYNAILANYVTQIRKYNMGEFEPAHFMQFVQTELLSCYLHEDRCTHGSVVELAVGEAILQMDGGPLLYQTSLTFCGPKKHDWVKYNEFTPVVLSVKVSLKDRWLQCLAESKEFRSTYPRGEYYILTLSEKAEEVSLASQLNQRVGEYGFGITKVIHTNHREFNNFVQDLRMIDGSMHPPKIDPISSVAQAVDCWE